MYGAGGRAVPPAKVRDTCRQQRIVFPTEFLLRQGFEDAMQKALVIACVAFSWKIQPFDMFKANIVRPDYTV